MLCKVHCIEQEKKKWLTLNLKLYELYSIKCTWTDKCRLKTKTDEMGWWLTTLRQETPHRAMVSLFLTMSSLKAM